MTLGELCDCYNAMRRGSPKVDRFVKYRWVSDLDHKLPEIRFRLAAHVTRDRSLFFQRNQISELFNFVEV
jgi:hypothetical protein